MNKRIGRKAADRGSTIVINVDDLIHCRTAQCIINGECLPAVAKIVKKIIDSITRKRFAVYDKI